MELADVSNLNALENVENENLSDTMHDLAVSREFVLDVCMIADKTYTHTVEFASMMQTVSKSVETTIQRGDHTPIIKLILYENFEIVDSQDLNCQSKIENQ